MKGNHMRFYKFLFIIIGIFLLFPQLLFAGSSTKPKAPYIIPQIVKEWIKDKKEIVLVDVRERNEFDAGHIEGAINIPYYQIENSLSDFIKADKQAYIFYCTYSAWRAPYAANVLADFGYKNSFVLEGGVSSWNAGGQVIYATNTEDQGKVIPYNKNDPKRLSHQGGAVYKQQILMTLEEFRRIK